MYAIIFLILILAVSTFVGIYFLRYCKKLTGYLSPEGSTKSTPSSYQPFVSIIVPTYNEAVVIEAKLRNTLALRYPPEKREILVIDSASTDGTAEMAAQFERITVVRQAERHGKSSALREAFALVKGEIVLITDADALLDENAVNLVVSALADDKVGAVTGRQVLVTPGDTKFAEKERSYRGIFDLIRNAESNMHSTMIFNGPLMAFKSEVLEAPAPDIVADDTEMALLVIRKGYQAKYVPEAIFYENIPLSDTSRLKQKERRAEGLVQSFWRHRDMLFNAEYGSFGKEIYPAEFAVHIVLPYLMLFSGIAVAIGLYKDFMNTLLITIGFIGISGAYAASTYTHIGRFLGQPDGEEADNKIIKKIAITAISFLQLQYALLMGSLKVLLFGGHSTWEQIEDARYQSDAPIAEGNNHRNN